MIARFLLSLATVLVAQSATASAAAAEGAHAHHIHKRAPAVVTEYVHQTQYLYRNAHVYVDQSGVPYTTSYEIVSTGAPVNVETSLATPSNSKVTSTSIVYVTFTSSSAAASSTPAAPSTAENNDPATEAVTSTVAYVPSSTWQAATTSVAETTEAAPTSAEASSSTPEATSSAPAATSTGSSSGTYSGQATFFDVGLGACGWENSDSELVAALNKEQFESFGSESNGNPVCGKTATLNRDGKTVTVKIVDKCPECAFGDLDLSPAAFDALADESEGRVDITWSWS